MTTKDQPINTGADDCAGAGVGRCQASGLDDGEGGQMTCIITTDQASVDEGDDVDKGSLGKPSQVPKEHQENKESDVEGSLADFSVSADSTPNSEGRQQEFVALNMGAISSRNIPPDLLCQRSLPKDTFSFLIYSSHFSRQSFLATVVFGLQTAIFILVSADVITPGNRGNSFNFPPNVEGTVRATEVLAIAVAIITQDDVRKAINLLRDGYDEDTFRTSFGCGASRSKWALSIFLRGCEGLLGLFVTFMLVMQSETVLDLLLNFSAMEFVSLIDDVVFALTIEGFFGPVMKKEATALSVIKYHISRGSNSWKTSLLTGAYFTTLFAVMLTGWGLIYANQASGAYLCRQLFLQLDDSLVPSLGTMSGLYLVNRDVNFGNRVTYAGNGMIGYCEHQKAWTLAAPQEGSEPDPCKDWIAASSESMSFDVAETASTQWYARTTSGRVLPIDRTYIECYDCKYEESFCGEPSLHGMCVDNKCDCAEGRYGLRCEFEQPCSRLEVDPRSEGFVGNRAFASKYHYLTDSARYHRPIYASGPGENVDIIMFTGRRWVLTSAGSFPALTDPAHEVSNLTERIGYYLVSGFHGYKSDFEVSFVSEAVEVDGRADMIANPLGLEWHPAIDSSKGVGNHDGVQGPDMSRSVDVQLICAECHNRSNTCFFEATCTVDGTCDCAHGSSGTLCQIPPLGNGRCETFFNNADFDFDGGDCCESSCVSTDEYACGKDERGYADVGYFQCKAAEADRWSRSGDPVVGVRDGARSGGSVRLGGHGGAILAVGEPGASIARLFDKDGSRWVQRGSALEGPPNSEFGAALALSAGSENVARNAFSSPTVTLAVGAPGAGLLRVYECRTDGCVQIGSDIVHDGRFGTSVSLSTDGALVAVGGASSVLLYKRSDDAGTTWELHGNPITAPWRRNLAVALYWLHGYYVTLSGNGNGIAIGSITGEDISCTPSNYDSANLVTQVFAWNKTTQQWLQVGDSMSKAHYFGDTPRSFWPQQSITLSHDAKVLAMGSNHSVDVYSWNEPVSNWIPRDIDLQIREPMGLIGWSVDLSGDGSTLAIGTSIESSEASSDSVIRIHKWNGTHYSPFFNALPAGETSAVSLSRDGKALAIGLPFSSKKGGTMVYKFRSSSECGQGFISLRLSFTTDGNPDETAWALQFGANKTTRSQSYSGSPFTTFVEEFCISLDSCIKFVVFDLVGNGMDTPGRYSLMLEGKEIAQGAKFEFGEIKHIGNCDCPPGTSPLSIVGTKSSFGMDWALAHRDSLMRDNYFDGLVDKRISAFRTEVFDECIPDDCWHLYNPLCSLSSEPSKCEVGLGWSYNVTYNGASQTGSGGCIFCPSNISFGECSPNEPIECDQGSALVRIEVTFNDEPWNMKWELLEQDTGDIVLDGGFLPSYTTPGVTMYEEVCKPIFSCFYFKMVDGAGGGSGFKVFLDSVEIVARDASGVAIGESCLSVADEAPPLVLFRPPLSFAEANTTSKPSPKAPLP